MKLIECVQGTDEWMQARAGNVTASRVADVMTKPRSKTAEESLTRRNYKLQLVAERMTGHSQELQFATKFTAGGTEQEPYARAVYEVTRDVMVDQPGFVLHGSIAHYGASPDGLVGDDGMVEIKCPKVSTHMEYLMGKVAPEEYQSQMLAGMDCCDRQWCDFISFCQALEGTPADHLKLFVVRFARDGKRIAEMQDEIIKFDREVDALVFQLSKV
jgi:putative phage-type endonuclease